MCNFKFLSFKVWDYWRLLRLPLITSDFWHFFFKLKGSHFFFLFIDIIFLLVIIITINYINILNKILWVISNFFIFTLYYIILYNFNNLGNLNGFRKLYKVFLQILECLELRIYQIWIKLTSYICFFYNFIIIDILRFKQVKKQS